MTGHLVFVYNADSNFFSTVTDFAHKLLSPSTYQCQLCALTYGNFSMKQEWRSFIETLPVKTVFLHKDEYEKKYQLPTKLPAVFIDAVGTINELIAKHELEGCQTLDDLKILVERKLEAYDQHHHTNIQ